jgi:prolyl-tRNA synthetase
MKYRDLPIQTQREFPNNARTEGFGWLVRAGYVTRENEILPLGERVIARIKEGATDNPQDYFASIGIPVIEGLFGHLFFITETGREDIFKCSECDYADLAETACSQNFRIQPPEKLPIEKVFTPDCHTIESLAKFLHVDENKTAKALMFIRISDGKFILVVMRGDTQLNPHKLRKHIGEVRPATAEEIVAVGAVPGFASAIGIKNALIVVDELIPHSVNLVAGANEEGYHLLNTNYGRDYSADLVVEIVQAQDGDICTVCEDACFYETKGEILVDDQGNFISENILLALAESHHDDKGLTLPAPAAPFDVYLMHIPGKTIDTKAKAEEIYLACQSAGLSVLFDDRDERAGVKFNDADLVGCPVRVTVGERGLKDGMVEVKARKAGENLSVPIFDLVSSINQNS